MMGLWKELDIAIIQRLASNDALHLFDEFMEMMDAGEEK